MRDIIVKLKDLKTGKQTTRTICASNVYNQSGGGYGTRDTQEQKLNDWIKLRANDQHNSIMELVNWWLV